MVKILLVSVKFADLSKMFILDIKPNLTFGMLINDLSKHINQILLNMMTRIITKLVYVFYETYLSSSHTTATANKSKQSRPFTSLANCRTFVGLFCFAESEKEAEIFFNKIEIPGRNLK